MERNGEGVLAYITNHGYLDNPTFRGMRWHLLKTFDDIYIIDLHGNAKKKKISPDGSPDKNVFDIQQGVAIILAIKHGRGKHPLANVNHLDMWGSRKAKYDALWSLPIKSNEFSPLSPTAPNYLFVPFNNDLEKQYRTWFLVSELFPVNSVGIVTARDDLTIHFTPEDVRSTVEDFANLSAEEARSKYQLEKDARDWKVQWAQEDLRSSGLDKKNIVPIAYRPFDIRQTYYTGKTKGFHCMPRGNVMQHMLIGQNFGLCLSKRKETDGEWDLAFISKDIITHHTLSMKEVNYQLPLYLYPETSDSSDLLAAASDSKRNPNLNEKIVATIAKKLNLPFVPDHEDKAADDHSRFSPLDLLDYIYAVLHSLTYRETYKEFLKIDFPRVPYPENTESFWQLAALGSELRQFHLLEYAALDAPIVTFPQDGGCVVEKPVFKDGKVYINPSQYFAGVPEAAWNFYIGGYQPAQKWLKDRKGRTLSFEDVRHYQKIIVALVNTDRLMKEIDATWQP